MPITRKIRESSYDIVFWRIDESAETLLHLLKIGSEGNVSAQDKRTAHHLAGKAAMHSLIPDKSQIIVKDEYGKPHTEDGRYHLSVSHSGDYAVAIGSAEQAVGIDIEKIGNRITRIAPKFVGDDEKATVSQNNELKALYLIWSAKEAMYKLYGRKALDFKENLFVEPFEINTSGELKGRIETEQIRWKVDLRYEFSEEYVLVWTSEAHREIID